MVSAARSRAIVPLDMTPQVRRLFIALWPDDALRARLTDERAAWRLPRNAAPVRAERLHLTLHFLGDVEAERVELLRDHLRAVQVEPFAFDLVERGVWPNGVALLAPRDIPPAFVKLHGDVGDVLQRHGIERDRRRYRPHVTLARRATSAQWPTEPLRIGWHASSCALVESHRHPPVVYRVLDTIAAR